MDILSGLGIRRFRVLGLVFIFCGSGSYGLGIEGLYRVFGLPSSPTSCDKLWQLVLCMFDALGESVHGNNR